MNPATYEKRRTQLRRALKRQGVPALLATHVPNVTYLTGFTGDDSFLYVGPQEAVLISDPRYETQIADECPGLDVEIRPPGVSMTAATGARIAAGGATAVGVEASSMTIALRDQLAEQSPSVEWIATKDLVEQLRAIKDRAEVELIRQAIRCAERGFDVLVATLQGEMTERQIAHDLEHQMRKFGASGCSFPPIVAAGSQAALPHARPGARVVGEHHHLLVDWGADVAGYKSDLTRVLVLSKLPPKLKRVYEVVLQAQAAAVAAIRPGAICRDVDAAARDVIAAAGLGPRFGHGLGHGIGLEIHEAPRMGVGVDLPLAAGMVVTVEPGVYLPGVGGVRIEDDVLVTPDGREVLTSTAKDLDSMHLSL